MSAENLLTPEELADAKLADMDDDEREAIEDLAEGDDGDDEGKPAGEAKGDKDGEEADDEDEDDDRPGPTFAPHFNAGDPSAFDAQLKDVREQRSALTKQWRNGEIDDDEYDAKAAELDEKKDSLIEQRATARTAATFTQQTAQQAFQHDKRTFLRTMEKYEGVPYGANKLMATAFETELVAVANEALAKKEDPSAQELFEAAHERVMEQMRALGANVGNKKRGAREEPAADTKPAGEKPPRQVPRTLGGLPSAAPSTDMDSELMQQAANLDGEDLELFIAGLSPAKRRALESAD